eukprot:6213640-Pleurochrysis_carterae.AAC.2
MSLNICWSHLESMCSTTSAKPCNKCIVPHRGKCYGEAIATSKLILEQVAEKFIFISAPARRPAAAAAALKRYQDHQALKGGGNPKPDKLERMCAMTKIMTCCNVDLRPATSPGLHKTTDTILGATIWEVSQCSRNTGTGYQ